MNTFNVTQVDFNTHKGRAFQRSGWDHWESQMTMTVLSGVNEALISNNVTLRTEIMNCESDSVGAGVVMSLSFISVHSQLC